MLNRPAGGLTPNLLHTLRVLQIYRETIADGEGLRYSIYFAGCKHACPGCHNPESWCGAAGEPLTEEYFSRIVAEINADLLLDGVTLSGGDPFYRPQALAVFLERLKRETGMNIWCYTGYYLEDLLARPELSAPLQWIDVLVDGPFILKLRDPSLPFRGSSNQRIIREPWRYLERVSAE